MEAFSSRADYSTVTDWPNIGQEELYRTLNSPQLRVVLNRINNKQQLTIKSKRHFFIGECGSGFSIVFIGQNVVKKAYLPTVFIVWGEICVKYWQQSEGIPSQMQGKL